VLHRTTIASEQLIAAGVPSHAAEETSGLFTLTLTGGRLDLNSHDHPPARTAVYAITDHRLILAWGKKPGNCTGNGELTWATMDGGIRFTDFEPAGSVLDSAFWTDWTWARIA
jgi:hypothetical protein